MTISAEFYPNFTELAVQRASLTGLEQPVERRKLILPPPHDLRHHRAAPARLRPQGHPDKVAMTCHIFLTNWSSRIGPGRTSRTSDGLDLRN
jgi:hypothetical protein